MTKNYPKIYIYKQIVQAKLFIDAHYSEGIALDNIAGEACFSKFHFIRLFKAIYGKTPHQYLTHVRIENAKELLQKEVAVSETCYGVGFDSISTFTGLFTRCTKISPFKYQQQFIQRREQIKRFPLQFVPTCFAEQNGWQQNSNFKERL